ncbi:ROK family protein [Flavobacterium rhizosphaerae]|uniref:ROK family protein n=1 Tax=Flavobacterium rhizosphaerae TaxID=3163298 RepID=A0ABW8YZP1_9FLAO
MYSIGVDIGGSHITSGMFEHSNNHIIEDSLAFAKVNAHAPKGEILDAWFDVISKSIASRSISEIQGIGIAMPGPFDYYNGISKMQNVDKLDALFDVNVRNELAARLEIDPSKVRFINDATAFSVAETRIGKASAYTRTVAITLGTGFGSSFVVNGQPVLDGELLPKGGFLYNQQHNGQFADDVFSTRGILKYYTTLSGNSVKNVQALCGLVDTDPNVQPVFNWLGKELGQFLLPYLQKFGAEVLVIGGNISKAYSFFGPSLTEALPDIEIYVSKFGEEAAIIGGALLLDDAYYDELLPTLKIM